MTLCLKISYYLGYYSSLNDEMGPNGGHFPKRSEIIILILSEIKLQLISSNINFFMNILFKNDRLAAISFRVL